MYSRKVLSINYMEKVKIHQIQFIEKMAPTHSMQQVGEETGEGSRALHCHLGIHIFSQVLNPSTPSPIPLQQPPLMSTYSRPWEK